MKDNGYHISYAYKRRLMYELRRNWQAYLWIAVLVGILGFTLLQLDI